MLISFILFCVSYIMYTIKTTLLFVHSVVDAVHVMGNNLQYPRDGYFYGVKRFIGTKFDVRIFNLVNVVRILNNFTLDNISNRHRNRMFWFCRSQKIGMQHWVDFGCPPHLLVMGITFYARYVKIITNLDFNMKQPFKQIKIGGKKGDFTRTRGILAYYELCKYKNQTSWTRRFNLFENCPYLINGIMLLFI